MAGFAGFSLNFCQVLRCAGIFADEPLPTLRQGMQAYRGAQV